MNTDLMNEFCSRAEAAGAVLHRAASREATAQTIVRLCLEKAPCELLLHKAVNPDMASEVGPLSPNGVPTRRQRVLALPKALSACLPEGLDACLTELCAAQGLCLVRGQLRDWLDGVDVGVSPALLGVADNGACLLDVTDEDCRLAGMIAETHVILLPAAALVPDLAATAPLLRQLQARSGMATYVTGPSRTADIERVAAVGVHGPLALHIILLDFCLPTATAEVPHV